MDIRHLQCITEIVRRRSFTKAAEALHLTQPSVSKIVKALEEELRVELFVRDGKQVKLTDAGDTIYRHAGPILQLFDGLVTELNELVYLDKGTVRIGMPPMAGARFFPAVIKRFQERYPGIAFRLVEEGAKKIEESLADGSLEAGVVLLPVDAAMFETYPIVDDRMNVLVAPSHPLAGRPAVELAELAGESFILFNDNFALHDRIIGECRNAGFEPRVSYESSQWDFIGELVGAGLGVAMLPDTMCRRLGPDLARAIPLTRPVIPWRLAMAWRKDGYLSMATREWIRFTRELFADGAGSGTANR
ncbi:LysR family transcriptional regulator [Paenibacillus lycopersici]|uniref:LysR family transcriptional regulator n=1 Tax=Paenibacillus lycopersici TaxID=2704462 RepID=A0A6C0FPG0_9BACL|nr:LysR family transcriptional regulator [Paenibacillus lycopersici]QHT58777.1 LysR family transcriptional regulator [Paenibacillus lycopersici]